MSGTAAHEPQGVEMATQPTPIKDMTKAQRKALATKAAKLKADGKSWLTIRQELHPGLQDPVGRALFREFGVGAIRQSYARAPAKAKRKPEPKPKPAAKADKAGNDKAAA